MVRFVVLASLLSVLIAPATVRSADHSADLKFLLNGVKSIDCNGLPGTLALFGPDAFALIGDANTSVNPVVAAATLGKGRIMVLSHEGFLAADAVGKADTRSFLINALHWLAQNETRKAKPRIIVRGRSEWPAALKSTDFQFDDPKGVVAGKPGVVALLNGGQVRAQDLPALKAFVEAGGGIILGSPGWGWRQVNQGKSLTEMPVNQLLAQAGLTIADDTAKRGKTGFDQLAPPQETNASLAADKVEAWLKGGKEPTSAESEMMRAAINRMNGAVPAKFAEPVLNRIKGLMQTHTQKIPVPTQRNRVGARNPGGRLLLGLSTQIALEDQTEKVAPHPASAAFPGVVPESAKRITQEVLLDVTPEGFICNGVGVSARADIWHSTGLYAAPGETITLTLPNSAEGKKLGLQIGCHTDQLWHLDSWQRAPEVTKKVVATGKTVKLANPFGGLIYVTSPVGVSLGKISVTITGGVEAPRFVRGVHTNVQWKAISQSPAPWAEFESDKVILVVPTAEARKVVDPEGLMAFWDQVMDHCADLTCVDRKRGRAERLVHDVQISDGYMHSGYPIMCPLGELVRGLDPLRMVREGAWGYFHELGHNHQQPAWTFDGTVEVTCNLYSLYCYKMLCPRAPLHEAIQPASIRKHAAQYLKNGSKFPDWKNDPFTALIMYKQLEEAFGWDAFKKAITAYQKLPALPRSNPQKQDQWMIEMSRATGKNLAPFFTYWGIPLTDAARAQVKDLAAWQFPDPTK